MLHIITPHKKRSKKGHNNLALTYKRPLLHDPFDVKREAMISFLLESIVNREIERQGNDVAFRDKKGRR